MPGLIFVSLFFGVDNAQISFSIPIQTMCKLWGPLPVQAFTEPASVRGRRMLWVSSIFLGILEKNKLNGYTPALYHQGRRGQLEKSWPVITSSSIFELATLLILGLPK